MWRIWYQLKYSSASLHWSSLLICCCCCYHCLLLFQDIGKRPSGTTKEDTFLLALVRRELKSLPLSSGLLDKLQKELKILDPVSSGFLLQSQLSHLFLRLEVPLQLPTVKILCQRFSRGSSPEMVGPSCYFKYEFPFVYLTCTHQSDRIKRQVYFLKITFTIDP